MEQYHTFQQHHFGLSGNIEKLEIWDFILLKAVMFNYGFGRIVEDSLTS